MIQQSQIEQMLIETPRENPIDDDMIVFAEIRQDVLDAEFGLFASKWFDYRHMTPMQATKVYIEHYGRIYREVYAETFDKNTAEHIRVVTVESVFEGLQAEHGSKERNKAKKNLTACWRGRQVADILGMPYDLYIQLAFAYRLRFWNQRYLPQPQHLYGEFEVEKIQARWQEEQAASLFTAQHPAYLVQNYAGAAHQDAHHEWLFRQAELRTDGPWHLAKFVRDDVLPFDKLEYRIAPEELDRVQRYLN